MSPETMPFRFLDLPKELQLDILNRLQAEHLAQACRISRHLNRTIGNDVNLQMTITKRQEELFFKPVDKWLALMIQLPVHPWPVQRAIVRLHPWLRSFDLPDVGEEGLAIALELTHLLTLEPGISENMYVSQPPLTFFQLRGGDEDGVEGLKQKSSNQAEGIQFKHLKTAAEAWLADNAKALNKDEVDGRQVMMFVDTWNSFEEESNFAKAYVGELKVVGRQRKVDSTRALITLTGGY